MAKEKKYFDLYPVHPIKVLKVPKINAMIFEPTPVMIKTLKKCFELEIEQPGVPYGPADVGRGFSGLYERGLLDIHDKGKTASWFITREGLQVLISKLKEMCHVVIAKSEKGDVVCITKKDSYEDCEIVLDNLEQLNLVYETTIRQIKKKNRPETPKKMGLILTSAEYKNYVSNLREKGEKELSKIEKPKHYKSDLYIF
jgi:hypothetical protein